VIHFRSASIVAAAISCSFTLSVSAFAQEKPATESGAGKTTAIDETRVKEFGGPPDSTRIPLLLTGVGFLGGAYGAGAAFAATSNDIPGVEFLYIPVAGPWIAVGENGCRPTEPLCDDSEIALRDILYIVSSLSQMGGIGLIAQGVFLPSGDDDALKAAILPMPVASGTGISIVGTF
jgi:hypothetical protein